MNPSYSSEPTKVPLILPYLSVIVTVPVNRFKYDDALLPENIVLWEPSFIIYGILSLFVVLPKTIESFPEALTLSVRKSE